VSKKFQVSFNIVVSDPTKPMNLLVESNNNVVLDTITNKETFNIGVDFLNVGDSLHDISVTLSGKNNSHTVLSNNEIVSSAQIEITNFLVDNTNVSDIISMNKDIASYTHSNNNEIEQPTIHYYDPIMGFNGTARFIFKTPVHMWLFDNS